jgi:hypothetical protein
VSFFTGRLLTAYSVAFQKIVLKYNAAASKNSILVHQTRDMVNLAKQDRKRTIRESLLYSGKDHVRFKHMC